MFKFLTALLSVIKNVDKLQEYGTDFFKWVRDWWHGKTIAVIGPTASGKNSLFDRLQRKPPPKQHMQTRGSEQLETFNLNYTLPDGTRLDLKCKNCINIGGEIDERERYWMTACQNADVIFYLIDGDRLRKAPKPTLDRIHSDFDWLLKNIHQFKPNFAIHLLLNKVDVVTAKLTTKLAVDAIDKEFKAPLSELETLAKDVFGPNFVRVSGLGPISIIDDVLFHRYFATALQAVYAHMKGAK